MAFNFFSEFEHVVKDRRRSSGKEILTSFSMTFVLHARAKYRVARARKESTKYRSSTFVMYTRGLKQN